MLVVGFEFGLFKFVFVWAENIIVQKFDGMSKEDY